MDQKIAEIEEMDAMELDAFAYTVSLSGIEDVAKKVLNSTIAKRQEALNKKVSALTVDSEVKMEGQGVEI